MTLNDLKDIEKDFLTCKEVSEILHVNQSRLHTIAVSAPDKLGFPVSCVGNRVIIPRIGFIKWMEGVKNV